jgi:hypothetical protein
MTLYETDGRGNEYGCHMPERPIDPPEIPPECICGHDKKQHHPGPWPTCSGIGLGGKPCWCGCYVPDMEAE